MAALMVSLLLLLFAAPALSLFINTTTKGCSRECESRHCQDPFRVRYGKYCGVGYTGCEGEAACDGIDSCCMSHDHCIGSDLANYVNRRCNDQLKHCVEQFQEANLTQFNGSTCSAKDLEDVIITSMNIATLGEDSGSLSNLANLQCFTMVSVVSLSLVLLHVISCTLDGGGCYLGTLKLNIEVLKRNPPHFSQAFQQACPYPPPYGVT